VDATDVIVSDGNERSKRDTELPLYLRRPESMLEFNRDVNTRARAALKLAEMADPANTRRGNEKPIPGKARQDRSNRKETVVKTTTRQAWNDHSESLEISTIKTRRGTVRHMPLTTLLQQLQPYLGFLDTKNTAQRDRISTSTGGMDIDVNAAALESRWLSMLAELPKENEMQENQSHGEPYGEVSDYVSIGNSNDRVGSSGAYLQGMTERVTTRETALTPDMLEYSEPHRTPETKTRQWHEGPYNQMSEYIHAGNGNALVCSASANLHGMTDYLTTGETPLALTEHMTIGERALDLNVLEFIYD
jgi:hypothetical protein